MENYLKETPLLDYSDKNIHEVIELKQWKIQNITPRVKSIYNLVPDEIKF